MTDLIKSSYFSKFKRRLFCLHQLFFHFSTHRKAIKRLFGEIIDTALKDQRLLTIRSLHSFIQNDQTVTFSSIPLRDGNTSYYEQIVLGSLIKEFEPIHILELGTFDGHSTLHFALNALKNTKITTVDLPSHLPKKTKVLDYDLPFVLDKQKASKLYQNFKFPSIRQIYADTLVSDFSSYLLDNKDFDFVFIDAGHSYECVKNDTEKSLKVLSKRGVIIWHDYTPNCVGVLNYLNELSKKMKLIHIENTSLVIYKNY